MEDRGFCASLCELCSALCYPMQIGTPTVGLESIMLVDALVALLITAIAVILGLTVHPLLFFAIAFAVLYLFVSSPRSSRRARSRATRL